MMRDLQVYLASINIMTIIAVFDKLELSWSHCLMRLAESLVLRAGRSHTMMFGSTPYVRTSSDPSHTIWQSQFVFQKIFVCRRLGRVLSPYPFLKSAVFPPYRDRISSIKRFEHARLVKCPHTGPSPLFYPVDPRSLGCPPAAQVFLPLKIFLCFDAPYERICSVHNLDRAQILPLLDAIEIIKRISLASRCSGAFSGKKVRTLKSVSVGSYSGHLCNVGGACTGDTATAAHALSPLAPSQRRQPSSGGEKPSRDGKWRPGLAAPSDK